MDIADNRLCHIEHFLPRCSGEVRKLARLVLATCRNKNRWMTGPEVIERLGISFLSHFRAHSYNHSLEAAISILQVYNVIFDIPWFQQDSESGRLILMEKLEVAMGFNNLKLLRGFFPDCSAAAATLATKSVEKRNRWPDFYYTSHDFMEILIATVGEMLREISPGETANDVREGVNFVFKNLETLLPADGHAIQAIRPRRTQFLQEWEQS